MSPLLDVSFASMSFASISSQSMGETVFSFLDLVFDRADVFNFNEVQFINHLFLWLVPLVLYLKRHHHTHGLLGFLLCYLLRVHILIF